MKISASFSTQAGRRCVTLHLHVATHTARAKAAVKQPQNLSSHNT